MTQTDGVAPWRFGRVRPVVWMALVGVLLVAIAAPAFALQRAGSSALAARACIWPQAPRAGEAARLVISLSEPADRAAIQGPWAHVAAQWDMVNMRMGTRQLAVPGTATHADAVTLPLRLDMPGPWWVRVTLRTPGRPVWQTRLQVMVAPPPAGTGVAPASVAPGGGCGPSGGRSGA